MNPRAAALAGTMDPEEAQHIAMGVSFSFVSRQDKTSLGRQDRTSLGILLLLRLDIFVAGLRAWLPGRQGPAGAHLYTKGQKEGDARKLIKCLAMDQSDRISRARSIEKRCGLHEKGFAALGANGDRIYKRKEKTQQPCAGNLS